MDEERPGAPRTISDVQVEEIVTITLESQPVGMTHWSTREMSQKMKAFPHANPSGEYGRRSG